MSISEIYQSDPGLIIGFHGCDATVRDHVIQGKAMLKASENKYDWLGAGMYFWQNSYERAMDFAKYPPGRTKIRTPAVLGAVFSLGNCLDLTDKRSIDVLRNSFLSVKKAYVNSAAPLPQNRDVGAPGDRLLRELDCMVINYLHQELQKAARPAIDTVRGVFIEGSPIYEGAGFHEKTHVQICIRNPNCIKGFFLPRMSQHWP